jgi:Oxidoreductase FAD-binding domain
LGCPIGKHIFVKIGDVERAYSPITTDYDVGYFDLVIKVSS